MKKSIFANLGFSFLELMVSLIIMGVLATIAFPIYSHHIANVKRLEAAAQLNKLAVSLEQYFMINNTYVGATLANLGYTEKVADGRYKLVIASVNAERFKLQAVPLQDQTNKDYCGTLVLESSGAKSITGSANIGECW